MGAASILSSFASGGHNTGKTGGRGSHDAFGNLLLRLGLSLGGAILGSSIAGVTGKALDYDPLLLSGIGAVLGFAVALATSRSAEQDRPKSLS
jgi:hypothetical protein